VVTICEVEELQLGEAESLTLYRAMRELLINVIKHAGVGTARVWIWRDGGMGRVTVEDSGVGFGPKTTGHGFGLLALRERLGELGGSLEIGAAPGGGTSAVASVPLSAAATRNMPEEVAPKPAPRHKRASARSDRSERV
jgi:signal transduction histidine kinase